MGGGRLKITLFSVLCGAYLIFPSLQPAWSNNCNAGLIETEKSLRTIYFALRYSDSQCHYDGEILAQYASRAYLAGRYSESIWAATLGLTRSKDEATQMRLHLYQGLSYSDMERYEEAIAHLKKAGFGETGKADPLISQRAHMALIEVYYLKSRKVDSNVEYLVNSFFYRYPQSPYTVFIQEWYKKHKA